MKFRGVRVRLAVCAIGLSLAGSAGCQGSTTGGGSPGDEDEEGDDDQGGQGGGGEGGSDNAGGPPAKNFNPAAARMHLLTTEQYRNSLTDLLGVAADDLALVGDVLEHGFSTVGATTMSPSERGALAFDDAARSLAGRALADDAGRKRLVPCTPTGASDGACAGKFIESFGRRAFRRPLTTEEVERLAGVFTKVSAATNNFWTGIEHVTVALLASPKFLYQVELGEPDPNHPERMRLTDFELATRLSFFLGNTTPDAAFLDAAGDGALSSGDGLREHVQRLLGSDRARKAMGQFFSELYALPGERLEKDPEIFPKAAAHATLGLSMRSETLALIEDLVFDDAGDVGAIFDAGHSFIDGALADLYGLPSPGAGRHRVDLPPDGPRGGILTHASILATQSKLDSTIPTRRGEFIREKMLCQVIPPPPPDAEMQLPEREGQMVTQRQKLAQHAEMPACATCHNILDPLGLVLESFDGIGAYRETDDGVAIDTSGSLDGVDVADARELGHALRTHPDTRSCLVRQLYRYATGHHEEPGEEPAIERIEIALDNDDGRFLTAVESLARSSEFRALAPAP